MCFCQTRSIQDNDSHRNKTLSLLESEIEIDEIEKYIDKIETLERSIMKIDET